LETLLQKDSKSNMNKAAQQCTNSRSNFLTPRLKR